MREALCFPVFILPFIQPEEPEDFTNQEQEIWSGAKKSNPVVLSKKQIDRIANAVVKKINASPFKEKLDKAVEATPQPQPGMVDPNQVNPMLGGMMNPMLGGMVNPMMEMGDEPPAQSTAAVWILLGTFTLVAVVGTALFLAHNSELIGAVPKKSSEKTKSKKNKNLDATGSDASIASTASEN